MQTIAVAARPKRALFPTEQLPGVAPKSAGSARKAKAAIRGIDPAHQSAMHEAAGSAAVLTEQDLLAMPEHAYMNEEQLAFFRRKLEQLRAELMDSASRTTADMRAADSFTPDPMDRATLEEEHSMELIARERDRKTLRQVALALARIASGEYGWCEETGEPIGLPRLLARPTAALSIGAQTRQEQRQRVFS